jgi:thioester reductase-like protein
VKKHFFFAPALLVLLTALNVMGAWAQSHHGWSYDPVVDHLKALETNIMKFEEYSAHCQTNPHETECEGINDHIPTQFMNYDEAVKLGNQHLEKERQRQAQPKPAKLTLDESVRQHQLLQKQTEEIVRDFCTKYPAVKPCSEKTPRQIARAFLTGRHFKH